MSEQKVDESRALNKYLIAEMYEGYVASVVGRISEAMGRDAFFEKCNKRAPPVGRLDDSIEAYKNLIRLSHSAIVGRNPEHEEQFFGLLNAIGYSRTDFENLCESEKVIYAFMKMSPLQRGMIKLNMSEHPAEAMIDTLTINGRVLEYCSGLAKNEETVPQVAIAIDGFSSPFETGKLLAFDKRRYLTEALEVANLRGPEALRRFGYEVDELLEETGMEQAIERAKDKNFKILVPSGQRTASGLFLR